MKREYTIRKGPFLVRPSPFEVARVPYRIYGQGLGGGDEAAILVELKSVEWIFSGSVAPYTLNPAVTMLTFACCNCKVSIRVDRGHRVDLGILVVRIILYNAEAVDPRVKS